MPTYPHIERYYEDKQRLIDYGGSKNELNIRPALHNCLDAYCREHRERLALVPELPLGSIVPDGTVKDSLRMARGFWESKDSYDDLDTEIQKKLDRGYPSNNTIYEDSKTAVLMRHGTVAMRADMSQPDNLHRLIRSFLDYELPEIEDFRQARQQFKTDLPSVLDNLREVVVEAESGRTPTIKGPPPDSWSFAGAASGRRCPKPTCGRWCSSTSSPRIYFCGCSPRTSSTGRTTSPDSWTPWNAPSSSAMT